MSDILLDGLLDELVRAEPRESWDDVLQRARRARRRYVALVVVVAVLVLAPVTWAAHRAFEGTPAPTSIVQGFARMNEMLTEGQAVLARSSLAAKIQQADLTKAHGVLQVQTPYGPLDLWVAPQIGGKGTCWFISWEREMNKPQGFGGGACSNPAVPLKGIDVGPQWDASHPSISVLYGTLSGPETTLEVKFKDGRTTTLPVVEHFVLGVVPLLGKRQPSILSFTGRDASGKVVDFQKTIGYPVFGDAAARRAAREFRKHWLADIARRGRKYPSQRFANLSKSEFRRRLDAAAARYGFTVESVQFLQPRQLAPLVVVRTRNEDLLRPFVMGNIFTAIDPSTTRKEGPNIRPFEALLFEAQDAHGVPYLVVQNQERGPNGNGTAWTRHQMNGPLGLFG